MTTVVCKTAVVKLNAYKNEIIPSLLTDTTQTFSLNMKLIVADK